MLKSNPFATRFIRPGAIEFLFFNGQSLTSLVEQLRASNWNGQIVGPHGSGKSTLLAALASTFEAVDRKVIEVRGQTPEIRGQRSQIDVDSLDSNTQLVIDGFEQWSWFRRRKVKQACTSAGAGLLVTAHADIGLPTLFRTEGSLELARAVVARLLPAGDVTINEADIARAYDGRQANIREMLFSLYDVYQQRQTASG